MEPGTTRYGRRQPTLRHARMIRSNCCVSPKHHLFLQGTFTPNRSPMPGVLQGGAKRHRAATRAKATKLRLPALSQGGLWRMSPALVSRLVRYPPDANGSTRVVVAPDLHVLTSGS